VIIFTASQRIYAEKLLNILEREERFTHHRLFRDSCVCVEGNYLKDLTVLGRPLSSTCILDNSVQAFGFQLDNGIPILGWFDDESDDELLKLLPFLDHLRSCQDVRPTLKHTFKLSEFVHSL
jgi:CTD small phosphatase-like protein 2